MPEYCCRYSGRFPIVATAVSLLAGCAPIGVADVSSPYYPLPATTSVVIRQTIPIPPRTAHVTLQDGGIVPIDRLRRYEPFCELAVNDVLDSEQRVRPGRFAAVHISRQRLLGTEHRPVLLAANTAVGSANDYEVGTMPLAGFDSPLVLNEVHLRLHSIEQPNVRELRCAGGWAFTSNVVYPTLAEMNRSLGPLASIEIN